MSRPFGSAAELERRRLQAVSAVQEGESPEAVARIVGVNRSSMYRWLRCAQIEDGLAAKPHPGPAPRLSSDQHARLLALLLEGAKAHGWSTQLWTCARVGELIRRHFGAESPPTVSSRTSIQTGLSAIVRNASQTTALNKRKP